MKNNTYSLTVSSRILFGAGVVIAAVFVFGTPLFANADTLNRQLEIGMNGTDVSALQTFLATDSTLYPQGLVTGYYGFLTKAAVSNFQSRNGISSVGRVGPLTLVALNLQMANGLGVGEDRSAPAITSLSINRSNTSAAFNWTTSESARGKLYYSPVSIRLSNTFDQTGVDFVEPFVSGTLAQYDAGSRTSQTVNVNGLTPNTTYFYLVESLDSSNNVSITSPASFNTTQ